MKTETLPPYLHPDDLPNFKICERVAHALASEIGVRVKVFEAKRRPLYGNAQGLCYTKEKRVSIAFRYRAWASDGGQWDRRGIALVHCVDTTAHEVAHLRHANHSEEFRMLEAQLMQRARQLCAEWGVAL